MLNKIRTAIDRLDKVLANANLSREEKLEINQEVRIVMGRNNAYAPKERVQKCPVEGCDRTFLPSKKIKRCHMHHPVVCVECKAVFTFADKGSDRWDGAISHAKKTKGFYRGLCKDCDQGNGHHAGSYFNF